MNVAILLCCEGGGRRVEGQQKLANAWLCREEKRVLLWRGVTTALTQARPLQPVDGMFVLDGAGLCYAARSKCLEWMVSEKLATYVVLDVFDRHYAKSRSFFWSKGMFLGCAVVGRPRRGFAWGKR